MKPSITLGVLCALFSEVAALTCYQCTPDTSSQTCTATGICSAGSCASMTVSSYAGDTKVVEVDTRGCLPADQCISGAMNFGIARSTISTRCCQTDRCNSQKTPELNTNTTPNGKKCFTCVGDDCTKQLSCVGNEDRCIKATTSVSGQTVTVKGCASSSICSGDLSADLGSVAIGLNCCEGNLCNSAKSVGQSFLLLLGSLVSVLLFH
ncbi:phospholipase A2 inhibitor and Ly6/PLAUR domain-containing protein-like [Sardina pilchardus]|uniref:phospholipase A2 inhibitor and Ly6/PLAUR domain-containing protein-like n=1 Tax=Sardina pilchardus TaxID=27697 RepID=UPI002E12091E